MLKSYKFKIYPTKAQTAKLNHILSECCRLYNAALQERIGAYKIDQKSLSWYDQKLQLKEIRASGDIGVENFSVASDVLHRLDKSFKAFFSRIKKGDTPGFPKFKSYKYYNTFTFEKFGSGCRFVGSKLYVQGVGNIKIRADRQIEGKIKTLSIKRELNGFYAVFSVDISQEPLPVLEKTVGIDLGLRSFIATSDGELINNPKIYNKIEKELRVLQRKLARCQHGSVAYRQTKHKVAKLHLLAKNRRNHFQHNLSKKLVCQNQVIAVEDLNVKGLQMGMLSKSVSDAAWAMFLFKIEYKANFAGRRLIKVNPKGTSQTCICRNIVKKSLAVRQHLCDNCNISENRDVMSAKVILQRALSS